MKNNQSPKDLPGCWKWFIGGVVLLIILLVVPFYLFTNMTASQDKVITPKTESIASSENLENSLISTEESSQVLSNDLKEQTALLVLRENYQGYAEVDFDEKAKIFTIKPTDSDFKNSLALVIAGEKEILPAWEEMKQELQAAYSELAKALEGDYLFNLVNPTDDEVVLSIMNGEIIYDGADQIN